MAKYLLQWKDPDIYVQNLTTKEDGIISDGLVPDEDYDVFTELGIGEYLCLEVDTDTKAVRVLGRTQ